MDLEVLPRIAVAMTQELRVERVMQIIVEGLTRGDGFALTRIWTKGPGDRCATCRLAPECADRNECLHLVASRGQSRVDPAEHWTGLDGGFSRFPLGVRKIGRIGSTGEALHVPDVQRAPEWIVDREWAARESLRSFAGHPLLFRGEVLGVLGIFCRAGIDADTFDHLRVFADQAAVALANARAFEKIDELRRELEQENALLRQELVGLAEHDDIVGSSPALRRMLEQVELVAPTDAAILIEGESGTGKELVARAIHRRSRRHDRPLVKVNCAAIPRELFESEFFGHVRGAFTGAVRDRVGRFQLADRGALFLDEVGEIPLDLQGKLLRVLQEGEFERIGEASTRRTNVRIIAATNRDLLAEVRRGTFREDLYYRLSVFPVRTPPLRERPEDIPALAAHFLHRAAERLGVEPPTVSQAQLGILRQHHWPGNIRELAHVIERAVIVARGGRADFSFLVQGLPEARPAPPSADTGGVKADRELRAAQIHNIRQALAACDGRIYGPDGAAAALGIPPTTLSSRIRRWGIQMPGKPLPRSRGESLDP